MRRPRESSASVCTTSNSPGPMPFLPHVFRNLPLLSNFMIRAFPKAVPPPVCPAPTKISPLAATATSVGASKLIKSRPRDPLLAEREQDLAILTQLEDLVAAVVGHSTRLVHGRGVNATRG